MRMDLKLRRFLFFELLSAFPYCVELYNQMSAIEVGTLNLNGARVHIFT